MNRTAKSQDIRGTMLFFPYAVITSVDAQSISEHCNLQILKATEINNFVCVAGKKDRSNLLDQPQSEITVISHNPFHPGC